jgi:hypothetical protein
MGQSTQGQLRTGESQQWTFAGQANQTVNITVVATFDSTVLLLDARGVELDFNDDYQGSTTESRLVNIRLSSSGTYTIVVSSYNNTSGGSYTLRLAQATASTTPTTTTSSVSTANTIASGQTVSGTVPVGSNQRWTFSGQAGRVVNITVAATFDSTVTLLGVSGQQLAFNDDYTDVGDSRILNFTLSANGAYTIVVGSFNNESGGSYTLNFTSSGGTAPTATNIPTIAPSQASASTTHTLSIGQTVNGTVAANGTERWTFAGQSGQRIDIVVTASFDSTVALLGVNGGQLAFNDDYTSIADSRILNFALTATGTYTVVVAGFDSAAFGFYTLRVSQVTSAQATATPVPPTEDSCNGEFGTINGCPDSDSDGWHDYEDNCIADFNPDQLDSDGNGIGDVCQ